MNCRACNTPLEPFMSFGKMPLANGFLTAEEIPNEKYYELAPAVCPTCSLFQIMEQPMPDRMFHAQYPFYTSNSVAMQRHFQFFAEIVKAMEPKFVVEIGCNDGTMLQHFKHIRHLGLEPAANVCQVAQERDCNVWHRFFDAKIAKTIVKTYGQADAVIAANVICHVADLPDLAEGVRTLLSPDGVFVFEEPYLPAMIARCSFDQIYDEHVFIFSATSVARAFARHGLYLIDCKPQWAHGGSMRYFLSKRNNPRSFVNSRITTETWLQKRETHLQLKADIEAKRNAIRKAVDGMRGRRVVGYGATSKSTTVTVYCGLGPDQIEYISDTTPIKRGKLSPGAHIPVRPYKEFVKNPPDVALLFAWNHREEIMAKEKNFKGQWLEYVPEVIVT